MKAISATVLLFLLLLGGALLATAQETQGSDSAHGYITALTPPHDFDLNGVHVQSSTATKYARMGDKNPNAGVDLSGEVQIGAYVEVKGSKDRASHALIAETVYLRDDEAKKLSGFGVIERVFFHGAESIFQVDGYRIHITAETALTFSGDLKSLANAGVNTWIGYEGKRDASGDLIATKAHFVPGKQGAVNFEKAQLPIRIHAAATNAEGLPTQDSLIDFDGNLVSSHTKVRMESAGGWCGWHRVPGDLALQERVHRIGMKLIPAYQQQMPVNHAAKIHFRFYVIEEEKIRSELSCIEGLILIPRPVAERLKSDDQLAAVLADGVAAGMQWQSVRLSIEKKEILGATYGGDVALQFVPVLGLASMGGAYLSAVIVERRLLEQRGRMALSLMAEAGYDPWQAPEAWRLLETKKMPIHPEALKYPDFGGYQLGILNLQYRKTATDILKPATQDEK